MENKTELKIKRIKELVVCLNTVSETYYLEGIRILTDDKYNELEEELVSLEKETGYILSNSPTQRVGTDKAISKELPHGTRMWSLEKANTYTEVKAYCDRVIKFCREHGIKAEWAIMWKFDGLTMHVRFENGKYSLAITRGNGIVGEDKTEQVGVAVKGLKKEIAKKDIFDVYGEAYMRKDSFMSYNLSNPENTLKSIRNGCVGVFTSLDLVECAKKDVSLSFYGSFDTDCETLSEQIEAIKSLGLETAEYRLAYSYEEIISIIEEMTAKRDDLPFEVDGIVIKLNNLTVYDDMGYTTKYPKGALAYKFESKSDTTKLIGVEWQVGRTGKVTPVGITEPIYIDNIRVSQATLNNYEYITALGLRIGDTVVLKRANDVIPNISEKVADGDTPIVQPTVCPICGSQLSKRVLKKGLSVDIYCKNDKCSARCIKALSHFASKKAANIDGISDKTVKQFFDNGLLVYLEDFYSLEKRYNDDPSIFDCIDNFKDKKITNLFKSITKSKNFELGKFIYSLGIDQVGEKISNDLANYFKTYDKFLDTSFGELISVNGVGEIIANSILEFFEIEEDACNEFIFNPQHFGIELTKIEDITYDESNFFFGKTVVITGTFAAPRPILKKLLESKGAKVTGTVSSKTDVLLQGKEEDGKKSSKRKQAEDNGIRIFDETEMLSYLSNK